ncbi:MAG: hypothetical protein KatS3mg016_1302 [Fimbriimonadales bacterium]|nr:MAG: hypothetical protein KatS3mg016_1302 [Fimbriimonadales bacterium]
MVVGAVGGGFGLCGSFGVWLLLGYGVPYPYRVVGCCWGTACRTRTCLSRCWDVLCAVEAAWIWLAGIRRLMRYLARNDS